MPRVRRISSKRTMNGLRDRCVSPLVFAVPRKRRESELNVFPAAQSIALGRRANNPGVEEIRS